MIKKLVPFKVVLSGLFVATSAVLLCVFLAAAKQNDEIEKSKTTITAGVDRVVIDRKNEAYTSRDKPKVVFGHERHNAALSEDGKKCISCHDQSADGIYLFSYRGTSGKLGNERKIIFHESCISCHSERAIGGKNAGPAELSACALCHADTATAAVFRQARMPLTLHALHVESKDILSLNPGDDKNCGACHHTAQNPDNKTLLWEPGKEQPCFVCHLENISGQTPSLETASHRTCLSCHAGLAQAGKDSGPLNCSACHVGSLTPERQNFAPKRLERGQPNISIVNTFGTPGDVISSLPSMPPVAFNHERHEGVVSNCSSCHHARIDGCGNCHTQSGKETGNYVNLYQSSHARSFGESAILTHQDESAQIWHKGQTCTGCHQQTYLRNQECAGCHNRALPKPSQDSCKICHVPLTTQDKPAKELWERILVMPKNSMDKLALESVKRRIANFKLIDFEKIPQETLIASLAREYEPARFPHDKIIRGLLLNARSHKLAETFHADELLTCAGCHHNSAPSLNPPACSSCHSKEIAPGGKIGDIALQTAYHQRCMDCHTAMSVLKPANTDCSGCHAPAKAF